jgi:KDO2-lipid IV(A) lauroyltransferase
VRRRRRRRSRRDAEATVFTDWRHRVEYAAVRGLQWGLTRLPLSASLRVGEALAWIAYLVAVRHRRIGMTNLAIAFPERSLRERRRILRASMLNLGRTVMELLYLPVLSDADLRHMVRFEDEQRWEEAITAERDTGGMILSGHFGNWELCVFAHGRRGYPLTMVHRTLANPYIDRWFNALRARAGTVLLRKSSAAIGALRAVRRGGLLVLPFDQNSVRNLGVFVPFFGVPACTNAGLALIALRTGAPVVPVFLVREGRSARHVVHLPPFLYAERTGDLEADVVRNTERFSLVFEDMVRRYPEQWLWVHRRWKTRPLGEPRFY